MAAVTADPFLWEAWPPNLQKGCKGLVARYCRAEDLFANTTALALLPTCANVDAVRRELIRQHRASICGQTNKTAAKP